MDQKPKKKEDKFEWSPEAIAAADRLVEAMARFQQADYKDRTSRIIARICRFFGINLLQLVCIRGIISARWRRIKRAVRNVWQWLTSAR